MLNADAAETVRRRGAAVEGGERCLVSDGGLIGTRADRGVDVGAILVEGTGGGVALGNVEVRLAAELYLVLVDITDAAGLFGRTEDVLPGVSGVAVTVLRVDLAEGAGLCERGTDTALPVAGVLVTVEAALLP